MPPIDFPSSPSNDQTYTYNGRTWTYNGEGWLATSTSSVTIDTTAADVFSVSGITITADDAGADKLVFWDDSASKLTHLSVGNGLSISGTEITVRSAGANLFLHATCF